MARATAIPRPMAAALLTLPVLALVGLGLTGCATLVGAAINPSGTANAVASDAVRDLTAVDPGRLTQSSTDDLDRILAEHGDASNAGQLRDLRGELAAQQSVGIRDARRDDLWAEYRSQHDRRLVVGDRRRVDRLVVKPLPTADDVPRGLRASPETHPHAVDPQNDGTPPYVLETDRVRFGQQLQ